MAIHIKKENKGKFNALKKRTGKSTEELTHSSNPLTRKRAIFAQNARKWHHHAEGGNVKGMGIGNNYPPTIQYPPEYGFGGTIQAFAPFLNLIPGAGPALGAFASIAGGMLDQNDSQPNNKPKANAEPITYGANRPTFSWGGRIPETMTGGYGPSGLTLGNVPNYNETYSIPPFSYTTTKTKRNGEIKNWSRDTNMNVMQHRYAFGGAVEPNPDGPGDGMLPDLRYAAVTNVGKNINIPLTDRNVNQKIIDNGWFNGPIDSLSRMTPEQRQGYIPKDSNISYEKVNKGTANQGGYKYYEKNRFDEGTDVTLNGKTIIKNPSKAWLQKNVPQFKMAFGGNVPDVPVELEKQEVYQEPDGDMGQVNGPSHEEGGVKMQLPENSFIWSDKLKTSNGRTFADEAARLGRMKAKYEKILKG